MQLRELRYFVAVYEELSLSAAAQKCFVAQPSISAAIQHLESELDCPLFVRHPRGVTPTSNGERLYPYACKLIEDLHVVRNLFKEDSPKITLRVALMPFLSGTRISMILKALLSSMPNLDLTVVDLSETADARVIAITQVAKDEVFLRLWRDEYVLAMPEGHPLTIHREIPLKQLHGLPFISRQPCDVSDAWKFATEEKGVLLDVKAVVKNEEYALDLVAAGLGISVVPSHSTSKLTNIVTRPVADLQLERVVGVAYQAAHPLPQDLIEAIKRAKEQMGL